MASFGLEGRNAIVAASTSGLGLGVAAQLTSQGARVALSGRRKDVLDSLVKQFPGSTGIAVDLTTESSAQTLVSSARSTLGEIDILVLNSGGPAPSPATKTRSVDASAALKSLLTCHMELVDLVLPSMIERGWGRIVAIGSAGIQQPLADLTLSNIGRSALAAYLKTLANEVAKHGVTVNMVLPGRIDTERVQFLDRSKAEREGLHPDDVRTASQNTIPAGRYGTIEEFAAVVGFLCSPAASYVTGEQIRCDGGLVRSY